VSIRQCRAAVCRAKCGFSLWLFDVCCDCDAECECTVITQC
jgi:hypothetical protein